MDETGQVGTLPSADMAEELDPSVWDIPLSDNARYFMNIDKYNSTVYYFAKTRFHNYFFEFLEKKMNTQHSIEENCVVGEQGIGKSLTTVYYVLSCLKKGFTGIHYIDMNLVKGEVQMRRLVEYANKMKSSDWLILDHVTLFNRETLSKVESLVPTGRILYIETGFSASLKRFSFGDLIGKEWSLERNEFIKIWMGSLKKADYNVKHQQQFTNKLYDSCKERFILTPRLLHRMHAFFVIDGDLDGGNEYDIEYFEMRYRLSLARDITEFELELSETMASGRCQERLQCIEFSLLTKVVLNQIKDRGSMLFKLDRDYLFKIPVNIFKCSYGVVKEFDSRFVKNCFQKGDRYVSVTLSVPELFEHWQKVFPFNMKTIFENQEGLNVQYILDVCFQSDAIRKEVGNEIVELQYQLRNLIVPMGITDTYETHCILSKAVSSRTLRQCDTVAIRNVSEITYIEPTLPTFNKINASKLQFQGDDQNVEKLAYVIKDEILKNQERCLIVNPQNMKGLDYVVYINTGSVSSLGAKKTKKPKQHGLQILHLVQVATGVGKSAGEALNVFKTVMDGLLPVHVTFIIARKESDTYTLNGNMTFEHASVVNLTHSAVLGLISQSKLLNGFVNMVGKS